LRANPVVLDGRYLFYLLRGGPVRDQVLSRASGSTVSGIRQAELVRVSLDLPEISAQRDISSTLGALDDKIESNRKTCLLLEEATQARFASLFKIEQRNAGVSLSELLEINPRRALKKGSLSTYVGMADLPTNCALVAEWRVKPFGSGQRFQNGDVLMARITPCLENGKTAVVDMLNVGEVGWGSTEYIVLNARPPLSMPWAYCLARSDAIRAFAIRNMSGSSGRLRFPASAFDKYLIDPPDDSSVSVFNSFAIPAFNRMSALRNESRTLVRLRDALLPELLSGRIRIAEATKHVEAQS
jgi:type I restriction enzyme S subunit